jgi:hypothetical protein
MRPLHFTNITDSLARTLLIGFFNFTFYYVWHG